MIFHSKFQLSLENSNDRNQTLRLTVETERNYVCFRNDGIKMQTCGLSPVIAVSKGYIFTYFRKIFTWKFKSKKPEFWEIIWSRLILWLSTIGYRGNQLITRMSKPVLKRGRHPGQDPRDPAVAVQEIWDRDSNSIFAGFGTGTRANIRNWNWNCVFSYTGPRFLHIPAVSRIH